MANQKSKVFTKIKQFFEFVADLAYLKDIKCIVCDNELKVYNRYGLCPNCELQKNTNFCTVCGQGIRDMAPICDQCKAITQEYEIARGALIYKDNTVRLVRRYKFGSAKYLADYFCEFMIDCYFENKMTCDIITFVPLHSSKLRVRGYNQAQVLAQLVGQNIGKPIVDTMIKVRQQRDTAKLNRQQRVQAVSGVFSLNESIRESIVGKSVLLIDDVYTTGATVSECCKILKANGCQAVSVLTAATSMSIKPILS